MIILATEPLDVIDWTLNENVHITNPMVYNRIFDVNPLVYKTNHPAKFKVALMWSLYLKTKDQKTEILTYTAEDIYIIEMEGNDDKERLTNLFENSSFRFEQEYDKRRLGTPLTYKMQWGNMEPKINATLLLLLPK